MELCFVHDMTREGKSFRILCVIDEFTRMRLALNVKRKLNMIERWRMHYNTVRSHKALKCKPPVLALSHKYWVY